MGLLLQNRYERISFYRNFVFGIQPRRRNPARLPEMNPFLHTSPHRWWSRRGALPVFGPNQQQVGEETLQMKRAGQKISNVY
jgi:hypothetical protein